MKWKTCYYNSFIPYKTIILHKICIVSGKTNIFFTQKNQVLFMDWAYGGVWGGPFAQYAYGGTYSSFCTATKELSVAASNQGL